MTDYHITLRRSNSLDWGIGADYALPACGGSGYMGDTINKVVEKIGEVIEKKFPLPDETILVTNNIKTDCGIFNEIKGGLVKKFPQIKFT